MMTEVTTNVSYLRPHYNATYNKTNYQLVDMEDCPDVSESFCATLISHLTERLADAGFGTLLSVGGVSITIEGVAHSPVEDVEDLTFHVTLHMPEGGQISVQGIMIHEGEVTIDHGLDVVG